MRLRGVVELELVRNVEGSGSVVFAYLHCLYLREFNPGSSESAFAAAKNTLNTEIMELGSEFF